MLATTFAPLGWDRVKVSKNLGATLVAPVAPVDTFKLPFDAEQLLIVIY